MSDPWSEWTILQVIIFKGVLTLVSTNMTWACVTQFLLHWLISQQANYFSQLFRLSFACKNLRCHQFGTCLEHSKKSHAPAIFTGRHAILHLFVFFGAQQ